MEALKKDEIPVLVEIKTEPKEYNVVIKVEPPEEPPDEETPDEEPPDKVQHEYPEIETVTVKIEPTYIEHVEHDGAGDTETYSILPDLPNRPAVKPTRKYKKRNKCESDEDYAPAKSKKQRKVKETVKKTYTTKAKKQENNYTEEVTQHIEVVTIDEEERQREFKELWHSRKHMRYTCELCAIGYVMVDPYTLHMKCHSAEAGDHECDICHCRVKTADTLYRHRLRHFRRYRCTICLSQHKDKETAASHVMSRHSKRAFTCAECGSGFKRPAYLKKHIAQQHTKSEIHECPVCQRVFYDKAGLRCHVRNHDSQARNPPAVSVVCDTCSRRFRNKAHLRRHVRVHAARAERCARCPATFKTRKGLRLHLESKHQDKARSEPSACPLCPRTCTNPVLLRQHIRRMHSDRTKKYQCDHCKRFYYSKGEVRSHIAWSHVRHAGSVHACACGRVFRSRARLRQHEDAAHRLQPPPRSYLCHCGKGFTSKQVLSRHMKGHEGLTYPCPECGLRFKSESYVKVHFKLRHLNMTRAQIKAEKQPRTLTYISGKKIYHKGMNGTCIQDSEVEKNDVANNDEGKTEVDVKEEDVNAIRVPLFDFVDLKQEPDDDYGD